MLVPAAAASTGKLVPAAVLGVTALRFATTGLYEPTDYDGWATVAGIVGLALCAFAVYAALAMAHETRRAVRCCRSDGVEPARRHSGRGSTPSLRGSRAGPACADSSDRAAGCGGSDDHAADPCPPSGAAAVPVCARSYATEVDGPARDDPRIALRPPAASDLGPDWPRIR